MKDMTLFPLLKENWRIMLQAGTYLVCTTQSATQHLEEQRLKYRSNQQEASTIVEELFENFHITYGTPTTIFNKLKAIHTAIFQQKDGETAYKDSAYMLRYLLSYSIYKTWIKAIEKPSYELNTPNDWRTFLQDHEQIEATERHILLFSFIKSLQLAQQINAYGESIETLEKLGVLNELQQATHLF